MWKRFELVDYCDHRGLRELVLCPRLEPYRVGNIGRIGASWSDELMQLRDKNTQLSFPNKKRSITNLWQVVAHRVSKFAMRCIEKGRASEIDTPSCVNHISNNNSPRNPPACKVRRELWKSANEWRRKGRGSHYGKTVGIAKARHAPGIRVRGCGQSTLNWLLSTGDQEKRR